MKRRFVNITNGTSIYEVGRSTLGFDVPLEIKGVVSKVQIFLALLPVLLCGGLELSQAILFPSELYALAFFYLSLVGVIFTTMLLVRLDHLRKMDALLRTQQYVTHQFLPALTYAGLIVSPSQSIRVLEGETVDIDPNENLYGANTMRIIRNLAGEDILQLENI